MKTFSLALVAAVFLQAALASPLTRADEVKRVVCYFGSWAVYRPGNGKFDVENIDPFICTHIIYGFAGLQSWDNTIQALDPYNDQYENWGKGAFERFTGLKKKNPALKALLAIGGWNEGSQKYSQMAKNAASRAKFVDSVVQFVRRYAFDGLDMDWEYPTFREGAPEDKANFLLLLKELKAAFQPYGLLLTAAVSAGEFTIQGAYDVPSIANTLDFINVMAYDYHGGWESVTGHNAPLYRHPLDTGDNTLLNLNHSIHSWIEKGAPPSKLNLGMPTYGRGFTLSNPAQNGLYVSAPQGIPAGPYTREAGFWGFNEICEKFQTEPGWTVVVDQHVAAPYAYKNNLWIGYDDVASIKAKTQFAMEMNLGGAMVWSVETDDFRGSCFGKPFILIKTIYETLNGPYVPPPTPGSTSPAPVTTTTTTTTTTRPTTTTTRAPITTTTTTVATPTGTVDPNAPTTTPGEVTQAPTTTTTQSNGGGCDTEPTTTTTAGPTVAPSPNPICSKPGYVRDQYDCAVFYQCVNSGTGGWTIYTYRCASGTVFDPSINACSWPYLVPGCENSTF